MLEILSVEKSTSNELIKEFMQFLKDCLEKEFCYEIVEFDNYKLIFVISNKPLCDKKSIAECQYLFLQKFPEKECEILKANIGLIPIGNLEILLCAENKNYQLLLEKVIKPNMHLGDILSIFKEKIEDKVNLIGARKILITDPYLLRYNSDDLDFLKTFFKEIKNVMPLLKEIILIIPKTHYNEDNERTLRNLLKELSIKLRVIIDEYNQGRGLFHDRFWLFFTDEITSADGLFVGASLNGFGKKYALVDYLREDDVLEIAYEIKTKYRI